MTVLKIPTSFQSYTNGQVEIQVQGATVAEAMEQLIMLHPSLRPHLYNSEGKLRPFVNLFINGDNIRNLQGMDTPLGAGDYLALVPSIAGG
jgi:molybdopterin synthase sulfur carrier subunit